MPDTLQFCELLERLPVGAVQVRSGLLYINSASGRVLKELNVAEYVEVTV